jgi:hypothetical protein
LRHFGAAAVDNIDETLISLCFLHDTINCYTEHYYCPPRQVLPETFFRTVL